MRMISMVCAGLALCGPAWALKEPDKGKADPRMATAAYNPGEVYAVHVPQGQTMAVSFAADEVVGDAFGPDKTILRAAPAGNTLVFWVVEAPMAPRSVIVRNQTANGGSRTYTLLVDNRPPEAAHLGLKFTYPEDDRVKQAALWRVAAAKKADAEIMQKVDAEPPCTNFAYSLQGKTPEDWNMLPTRQVCDDGVHTYFWFPGSSRLPVIYDGAGKEAVVDPTWNARTGIAVVHHLSTQWHLRQGDPGDLLCVFNRAYDPVGRTVPR